MRYQLNNGGTIVATVDRSLPGARTVLGEGQYAH